MYIKSLSVRLPFAHMILTGRKTIEYRSWYTNYRGDLLIVGSKSRESLRANDAEDLRLYRDFAGRAVCLVTLSEVSGAMGDYRWHLTNPRPVDAVEVRGFASLFSVPASLLGLGGAP